MGIQKQAGQALLVVILLLVVGVTMSLAVVSQTIINQRNATNEAESQKAYAAAEAGIQLALQGGCTANCPVVNLGNNASIVSVNSDTVGGGEFLIGGGSPLFQDNGADIWFVGHKGDGTLDFSNQWGGTKFDIWWEGSSCPNVAAMEVIAVMGTSANTATTKRFAYDPCSRSNNMTDGTTASHSFGSTTFTNHLIVSSVSNLIFARVIPLYSGVNKVDVVMPSAFTIQQGLNISATGSSGNTERKVNVFKGYPQLPAEFFYVLLSPK